MRLSLALVLTACAGCAVAAGPPPPVKVEAEWKRPSYEAHKNSAGTYSESWHYEGEPGTTWFITRTGCISCEPVGHELIPGISKGPTDVVVSVQGEHHPAEFKISTDAFEALTTSYSIVIGSYSYGLHLIVDDNISARKSMELQQKLLRMVQDWAPE